MEFLKKETVMIMETDRNRLSTIRIIAGIMALLCGFPVFGACCYGMWHFINWRYEELWFFEYIWGKLLILFVSGMIFLMSIGLILVGVLIATKIWMGKSRMMEHIIHPFPIVLTTELADSMNVERADDEYTAVRHKKISLSKSMDQVYVNQPDALRVNTIEPKSTVKWRYLSAKLREETNNLEELFKSINAFYQFMTEVDCAKKVIKPCSIQDVIDIYQQKYPEIEAIEKIKQEMYRETEFLEIAKAIYLLDNTSFQEHGFDLANPKMIEEAIDNGRIKPFPRARNINTEF